MPEITPILLGSLLATLALGLILGWILRGGRISREKSAINVSWQNQINAQKTEHDRLADQNKSLMEQISQYQASKKDSDLRAKELSNSLKEAFEKRDELQRQLKESRNKLDVAVAHRNKLKADLESGAVRSEANSSVLKDKDEKIFKLSRELESWRNRLPPLMERFRLRDLEAQEIEVELKKAQERVAALEKISGPDQTRIEPVDTNPIADGLDASNDQYDETSEHDTSNLNGRGQQDSKPADDDLPAETEIEQSSIDSYRRSGTVDFNLGEADFDRLAGANEEADNDDTSDGVGDPSADADSEGRGRTDGEASEHGNGRDREDPDGRNGDDGAGDIAELTPAGADENQTSSSPKDDLKQIKGVGPAIEKTLNDLGIYRFNQIAEMSEYDIDRVAQELRGFRSRIYREDWIGQARILQLEKGPGLV